MLEKFKFNPKDLFIGLIILIPLIVVTIYSYNPSERALIKNDEQKRNVVNALGKASLDYFLEFGKYPSNASALNENGVLDYIPDNPDQYKFLSDQENLAIYTPIYSLAWRELCEGQTSYVLYSVKHTRSGVVCGENLNASGIEFMN